MNWFSVPGATEIHDTPLPPFHVVKLRNPLDWWTKLGLTRFDINKRKYPNTGVADIGDLARLDVLYRKLGRFERKNSWHHWVYAADNIFLSDEAGSETSDKAFNDLLQYRYANPANASADFHVITCPLRFLCHAWHIKAPTLLHFTTERLELDPEYYEGFGGSSGDVPGFEKVTVRVIELPIKRPIPGSVFPSYFNQMKFMTGNSSVWSSYDPWNSMMQAFARLDEICHEKEKAYPRTYGWLIKAEEYWFDLIGIKEPSGLEEPGVLWEMLGMLRLVTLISSDTVRFFAAQGWEKLALKFRHPSEDLDLEDEDEDEPEEPSEDNFLAQMFKDFTDSLMAEPEETINSCAWV